MWVMDWKKAYELIEIDKMETKLLDRYNFEDRHYGNLNEHEGLVKAEAKEEGIEEGIALGKVVGKAEGIAEGKAEGIAEGKAEGIAVGKAEGKVEGIAVGKEEEKVDVIRNMLQLNIDIEIISEVTNKSPDEINVIKDQVSQRLN